MIHSEAQVHSAVTTDALSIGHHLDCGLAAALLVLYRRARACPYIPRRGRTTPPTAAAAPHGIASALSSASSEERAQHPQQTRAAAELHPHRNGPTWLLDRDRRPADRFVAVALLATALYATGSRRQLRHLLGNFIECISLDKR
ncbi:hypothetical protein MRX96_054447 [Rhipicephalus microplus]